MKIDLNQIWEWIKGNALPLSVVANMVLVALVAVLLKGSVSFEDGVLRINLTLQDHIEALFKNEQTQLQARSLLEARGYYEISKTHEKAEAVTSALRELGAGHSLVNELRELSHKNKRPFEPLDRKVTLMLSDPPQVDRKEARICEDDKDQLQTKYIELFTPDEKNLVYVVPTKTKPCLKQRNIVEISPADWRTLQLPEVEVTDATARVYLHRPYEHRADPPEAGGADQPDAGVDSASATTRGGT